MSEKKPKTEESLSPTTTMQQDLVVAGQRRINLIWESTQGLVASSLVLTVCYAWPGGYQERVLDIGKYSCSILFPANQSHPYWGNRI